MTTRHPMCENDDCQADGEGGWIHAEDCDAPDHPELTDKDRRRIIADARPGSFLADVFGPAVLAAMGDPKPCEYNCGPSHNPNDLCDADAAYGDAYCAGHRKQVDASDAQVTATEDPW